MPRRASKTAYELHERIVAQAETLHGPWPAGMTLFVFDDAYGWSASVSPPACETELCYRDAALAIINDFKARYDPAAPYLPNA